MAIDSNLGAVVGAEEGAIESIPGNEGRIAQARVNVRGGLRVFSAFFWHAEVWTPRSEALLEAVLKQQEQPDTRGWSHVVQACVQKIFKRVFGSQTVEEGCQKGVQRRKAENKER